MKERLGEQVAAVTVGLAQLKMGDKIVQDVMTPKGGVLFHKGKVVTPRELEILQAFLVPRVVIEGTEDTSVSTSNNDEDATFLTTDLQMEYKEMYVLLKKVHQLLSSAQPLPILEVRTQLEKLIAQLHEYNVLTFIPEQDPQDEYYYHSGVMSAMTSYCLAQWVGLPHKDWVQVALAGLFHDIGNTKIDKDILNKPGTLTHAELEEMKQHTVLGYQMIKNAPALNEGVKLTVLQHHERVDGSGYPNGIDTSKIHKYAKIVAIADIFHAMTLNKAYRKAVSPYIVLEQLFKDAFGKLDPAFVQIFIEKVTQFHNGTVVRLSDNRVGEIVFSDRNHPTRPWVSVDGTIVNLTIERQLHIEEVKKR